MTPEQCSAYAPKDVFDWAEKHSANTAKWYAVVKAFMDRGSLTEIAYVYGVLAVMYHQHQKEQAE